jgi:hypothetical protein
VVPNHLRIEETIRTDPLRWETGPRISARLQSQAQRWIPIFRKADPRSLWMSSKQVEGQKAENGSWNVVSSEACKHKFYTDNIFIGLMV